MLNCYNILEISNSANTDEIKKAYRKQALEWHPDINKSNNANEMFIKINYAYSILIDNEKRKVHDSLLNINVSKVIKDEEFNNRIKWESEAKTQAQEYVNMGYNNFKNKVDEILEKTAKAANIGCTVIMGIMFLFGGLIMMADNINNFASKSNSSVISLIVEILVCAFLTLIGFVLVFNSNTK